MMLLLGSDHKTRFIAMYNGNIKCFEGAERGEARADKQICNAVLCSV